MTVMTCDAWAGGPADPCAGHACDNCGVCRSGICCQTVHTPSQRTVDAPDDLTILRQAISTDSASGTSLRLLIYAEGAEAGSVNFSCWARPTARDPRDSALRPPCHPARLRIDQDRNQKKGRMSMPTTTLVVPGDDDDFGWSPHQRGRAGRAQRRAELEIFDHRLAGEFGPRMRSLTPRPWVT